MRILQHTLHPPLFSYHLTRLVVHVLLNLQRTIDMDLIKPSLKRTCGFHGRLWSGGTTTTAKPGDTPPYLNTTGPVATPERVVPHPGENTISNP
jgi:hypothetical protein